MALFAIEARESQYQGLHGVLDQAIKEFNHVDDAFEYAHYLSEELIYSYGLEPEPDEDSEEEWTDDDYSSAWAEAVDYSVWVIPDRKGKTISELEDLFYNDPDTFIKDFCENV